MWVCKNCGSTDIEVRLWFKPNAQQPVIKDFSSIEDEEVWCHVCDGGGFGIKKQEENVSV